MTLERAAPALAPRSRHWIRRLLLGFALLLFSFVLMVWMEGWLLRLPPLAGKPAFGERVGILHVHTNASCGSGTLPQVIAAAKDADLSFLSVTDHNTSMSAAEVAAADPPEFAVIDGEEVSTSSGHFLALGLTDAWPRGASYDARSLMASTRRAGAVNFVAHPYGLRDHWHDWSIPDYDGMEIFNDDAVWRKNTAFDILVALLLYPVNPRLSLLRLARTPTENLAKWDELQQQRPVAGICGSDAHAAVMVNNHVVARFPSYLSVFSLTREHVLLENNSDPDHAGAEALLAALKQGNSFCAVDALYPADGFTQTVRSQGNNAGPGDALAYAPGAMLHVALPTGAGGAMIRVLRDGHEMMKKQAKALDLALPGPGHYRTEAYLRQPGVTGWRRWTLWIFANPVNVTSGNGPAR